MSSENQQVQTPEPPAQGGSSGWKLYVWLVLAILLFAGGVAFYHFSEKNASRFEIVQTGNEIVLKKGIFFVYGSVRYDGGPAYAPIEVPPKTRVGRRTMESLEEVDAYLFDLLTGLVKEALRSPDQGSVARAKEYLRRARMLGTITDAQEEQLQQLKAGMDMARGQAVLRGVLPIMDKALAELRKARLKGLQTDPSPEAWILWLEARQKEFKAALESMRPPREFTLMAPGKPGPAQAPRAVEPTHEDATGTPEAAKAEPTKAEPTKAEPGTPESGAAAPEPAPAKPDQAPRPEAERQGGDEPKVEPPRPHEATPRPSPRPAPPIPPGPEPAHL